MSNQKKEIRITKGTLILRIVVSAYLLYTVYQLYGSFGTAVGKDRIFILAAMVIFTVVALPLGGFSIKAFHEGQYIHPEEQEQDEEQEDEKVIESKDTVIEEMSQEKE